MIFNRVDWYMFSKKTGLRLVDMDIDRKTIIRLSRYKDAVKRLGALNFVRVFSRNLADATGVSAAQVRKDFSIFGITGNRRGGYYVEELERQLNRILGKDFVKRFVVVGVGNIGRALMDYEVFEEHKIEIVAGFDINPEKFDSAGATPVMPLDEMSAYVRDNEIGLGIISVPAIACQQVFELMVAAGIKGIVNFAPIWLQAPDGVVVNNINLLSEFENLVYFAGKQENNEDRERMRVGNE